MTNSVPGIPIADVLAGLEVPPLPGNAPARAVMALIKFVDGDGDESWAVRVAGDLTDDELLGTLSGYVEHLKQEAAAGWGDFETTRVSG